MEAGRVNFLMTPVGTQELLADLFAMVRHLAAQSFAVAVLLYMAYVYVSLSANLC